VFAALWVLGSARWKETDSEDPRKVFTQEVFATVKAQMPWATQNGSQWHAATHKIWSRFRRRQDPPEGPK
jgi:hypothetical protein